MQDSVHSGLSLPGPMVYRYTMTFPFPQSRFPRLELCVPVDA
jgi:hypothetical protein